MRTQIKALLSILLLASPLAAAQTSNIRGTVRTHGDVGPLPGAQVEILRVTSVIGGTELVATGVTGPNGTYDLSFTGGCGLWCHTQASAPGRVVVPARRTVSLAAGASLDNQDFTASFPVTINVRVADAQSAAVLVNSQPRVYSGGGSQTSSLPAPQPDGSWQFTQIAPYALNVCAIDHQDSYINECQNGQQLALSSNVSGVTAIIPGEGETLNLQLDLDRGATVTGEIRDRFRNLPLANRQFTMEVFTIGGALAFTTPLSTDGSAIYQLQGLPPGSLRLTASVVNPFYTKMRYPGIDCIELSDCSVTAGSYLTVIGTAVVDNVGFDLFPGSVVRGRVTDAGSGNGLVGIEVVQYEQFVFGYAEFGRVATVADGQYELAHIRPQTVVRMGTQNTLGYANRAWPDVACIGSCWIGTNLTFAAGEVSGQTNFSLPAARAVAGSVSVNQAAPTTANWHVEIYRLNGAAADLVWSRWYNAGSTFVSPGLDAGTYFARSTLSGTSPQCQVFLGQACPPTSPQIVVGQATPIVLPATTGVFPGVDFAFTIDPIFDNGFEP